MMAKPWLIAARVLLLAGSLVSLLHAADPALVGDVYVSSGASGSNFNQWSCRARDRHQFG
jgi:hypothetical protein